MLKPCGKFGRALGVSGGFLGQIRFMPHPPVPPLAFREVVTCVEVFHDRFGIPQAAGRAAHLGAEEAALRHRLMAEENDEYLEAALRGDMAEVADALGDQLYILCGTMLRHGLHEVMEEVFLEIQSSNLSKLGPDGRPLYREDGKVIKGPNYRRPDVAGVLARWLEAAQAR